MNTPASQRLQVSVVGTVQGVGFRPFAFRLARQLGIGGWVMNTSSGALLEVEGSMVSVDQFLQRLTSEVPNTAWIEQMTTHPLPTRGQTCFTILANSCAGDTRSSIAPDMAPCQDCLHEMGDPGNRRYRYSFISCAKCGPRYSILTNIPYARRGTTMERFPPCPTCIGEYEDGENRRYHAESLVCPICGPTLTFLNGQGTATRSNDEALLQACDVVRRGGILAVKGLGGFQLWVDAQSETAIQRLRERKLRPDKPFAVLFPSLEVLKVHCVVSSHAEALLSSPQAPIVILPRLMNSQLADAVAPQNPTVGAMLPATPLHHRLMPELRYPVVATSGNRSGEPLAIDNEEAVQRLKGIADGFLCHDRVIARPLDDSVLRTMDQGFVVLRRARGFCPAPLYIKEEVGPRKSPPLILGVGGQLKNAVAYAAGNQVLLSQHIGDLSTSKAVQAFRQTIQDQEFLFGRRPEMVACDFHPDYRSSLVAKELAQSWQVPLIRVQHHHAHVASCMAEHSLTGQVLGVAWDGSGFGEDGMIWGGEFLKVEYSRCVRLAHLHPFRLPGGEQAVREPQRVALSLLWEAMENQSGELDLPHRRSLGSRHDELYTLLQKGYAFPLTTSIGRLFDAVASFTNMCQVGSFEGQAAMNVENAAVSYREDTLEQESSYSVPLLATEQETWVADWRPMIRVLIDDVLNGVDEAVIAYRFHQALANLVGEVATIVGLPRVVLTGGCFQNMFLTNLTKTRLEQGGFTVYTHQQVPPNDGGLAVGQVMVAASRALMGDVVETRCPA